MELNKYITNIVATWDSSPDSLISKCNEDTKTLMKAGKEKYFKPH